MGMPKGKVVGFVEGFSAGVGLLGEEGGSGGDALGELMALTEGGDGSLDADMGVFGTLVVEVNDVVFASGVMEVMGSFGVMTNGPVVVFGGAGPGVGTDFDFVLMATPALIAGATGGDAFDVVSEFVSAQSFEDDAVAADGLQEGIGLARPAPAVSDFAFEVGLPFAELGSGGATLALAFALMLAAFAQGAGEQLHVLTVGGLFPLVAQLAERVSIGLGVQVGIEQSGAAVGLQG